MLWKRSERIFKPEFLNRIDETIVFHALTKEDMKQIVTLLAKTLVERCRTQMEIELHIRDSVKAYIVETAYDPKYGARPLRRMIQSKIEECTCRRDFSRQDQKRRPGRGRTKEKRNCI